jgi:hypothetical protein
LRTRHPFVVVKPAYRLPAPSTAIPATEVASCTSSTVVQVDDSAQRDAPAPLPELDAVEPEAAALEPPLPVAWLVVP